MKKELLFAFAFLGILLFVGCGGESGKSDDNPDTDSVAIEKPVKGGTVIVHHRKEPDNLNPFLSTEADAGYIRSHIFQYPTEISPETMGITPVLTKGVPRVSEDGLTYYFEFKEEAVWDDGSPVTGEDYYFSIKCIKNPLVHADHLRTQYDYISEVIIDPENPKKFSVSARSLNIRGINTVSGFTILSKKFHDPEGLLDDYTIEQLEDVEWADKQENLIKFADNFHDEKFGRDPAFIYGTGPYKLESWTPDQEVVLVRKENYWGEPFIDECIAHANYPDKIIYKIIPEQAVAVTALKNQEIDIMKNIPVEDFLEAREGKGLIAENYDLFLADQMAYTFVALNCRPPVGRPPYFEDQKVRRAMAHVIDAQGLIDKVQKGIGAHAVGPVYPKRLEFNSDLTPIPFDLEKAKQLLDEAGWKDTNGNGIRDKTINGKLYEFQPEFLYPDGSESGPQTIAMIKSASDEVGLDIKFVTMNIKEIQAKGLAHDFDMFSFGHGLPPLPPDLKQVWHSENWVNNGMNYFGFVDPVADSLIMLSRSTLDPEKRKPIYDELQKIIYDFQPAVFMRVPQEKIAIHKRFKNKVISGVRPGFFPNALWVPKEDQKPEI